MTKFCLMTSVALLAAVAAINTARAGTLVGQFAIPGDTADLSGLTSNGANTNRLGFFSDLYYDRFSDSYFGLSDRGPGGGTLAYDTRVQQFTLSVDRTTGATSNFQLKKTILFKDKNGVPFNGLNPQSLNGNAATLGNSFDPEGFVIGRNGHYYVSDEYGPSVNEFDAAGTLVRTFSLPQAGVTAPGNVRPALADGTLDYVAGRSSTPPLTLGRQDNRGFEGLAISPDGGKLYAMLQDPLVNEGASNDGRRSQNLRMVEFDIATGQPGRQFIYPLESIAAINARLPADQQFGATAQGRNIGISAVVALNDHQFLVLERDNRGIGVDNPTGTVNGQPQVVGSKRVYLIDIAGATDVGNVSLAGSNSLPAGVVPVSKSASPYLDIQSVLDANGLVIQQPPGGVARKIPEKFEGLAIGPQLADGSYVLLFGTDNDYSVTQNADGNQFDVYINGLGGTLQAPVNTDVSNDPAFQGYYLIPGFLYAYRTEIANYVPPQAPIPEPATAIVLGGGLLGLLASRRRA